MSEESVPQQVDREVDPQGEGQSLEKDLRAGAQVVGSFFGSAWSKAAEGAAFFSFATGPDDDNEESLQAEDLPESSSSALEEEEKEEEENYSEDPLTSLFNTAMSKIGLSNKDNKDKDDKDSEGERGERGESEGVKASESSYSLVDSAYSVFEKAKKTLEDNIYSVVDSSPLYEFTKDEEENARHQKEASRLRNYYRGLLPWLGYELEAELKEKVLALSSDKRNFLFDPPEGVSFDFEYNQATGVAEGLLSMDENLQLMRYRIVPKLKTEEAFWRNYFYRVSLIQQCYELKSVEEYVSSENTRVPINGKEAGCNEESALQTTGDDEFVSESFQAMDNDEADNSNKEVSKKKYNNRKKPASEADEIEAELENELQEYEVVIKDGGEEDGEWDNQLEELLDS